MVCDRVRGTEASVGRGAHRRVLSSCPTKKSCRLRGSPVADRDRANFSEGRKISALAFGCAAVISAGASGVARHGGQGCEKGEDGRRRNLRTLAPFGKDAQWECHIGSFLAAPFWTREMLVISMWHEFLCQTTTYLFMTSKMI